MKNIFFNLSIFLMLSIVINAQQNSPMLITGSSEDPVLNPVFSPDGKYIAFTKTGFRGLYIYDMSADEIKQLSDELSAGFAFRWSSDSKSILSRVARYENRLRYNSLKIFHVENGKSLQLSEETTSMQFLPEWIPGNDRVILPRENSAQIFQTDKELFLRENEKQLVVYSLHNKIVVKDFSTSVEKVLTPFPGSEYLNVVLSPDKQKIVFEVYGGNLFVMNTDGSAITDLGIGYNPKWISDSENVVFMITQDDGHNITSSDIFIINIDGSGKTNLTNTDNIIELNPSISQDGNMLVYESYKDGGIYLMKLD